MTRLMWDQAGQRTYETGVSNGVLFLPTAGAYDEGVAWNGLVSVTEAPSGAEAQPQYADNIKYLELRSAEEFGGTIEALTYPDEWAACDGSAVFEGGISIGQQTRKSFGLAFRTILGNDTEGESYGYKLHLVDGATVTPSEKQYSTVNDSPEPITFSWEFTTVAVDVGVIGGTQYKPTSIVTLDSTKLDADAMADLEDILYGTAGTDPRLPLPAEVVALFAGTVVTVTSLAVPAYNSTTKVITIPTTTGVKYTIDGVTKTGTVTITKNTIVKAVALSGYNFPADTDTDWQYTF